MKLTDERLAMLPEQQRYWVRRMEDQIEMGAATVLEHSWYKTVVELAHALEQVAAAKLMAEALETDLQVDEGTTRALASGRFTLIRMIRVRQRYRDLTRAKKQLALAAWKALETQDGEDDGE